MSRSLIVDVVRILFVCAILVFHLTEATFYTDESPIAPHSLLVHGIHSYARYLSFSGFGIVAVSFFMMGTRKSIVSKKTLFLTISGILLLTFSSSLTEDDIIFEWDIYEYLIVALLSLQLFRYEKLGNIAMLAGAAMLALPQVWFSNLSPSFLFGGVKNDGSCVGWALFPWIGLTWFSFGWGKLFSRNLIAPSPSKREWVLWTLLLLAAAPLWGKYYEVPIGPSFSCFMFSKPALFFSHMIPVFLALRLFKFQPLNALLLKVPGLPWISDLSWNRYFGLTYLLHLPLLVPLAQLKEIYMKMHWIYALAHVVLFVGAEILSTMFQKFLLRPNRDGAKKSIRDVAAKVRSD
jgi:hypothetical protein